MPESIKMSEDKAITIEDDLLTSRRPSSHSHSATAQTDRRRRSRTRKSIIDDSEYSSRTSRGSARLSRDDWEEHEYPKPDLVVYIEPRGRDDHTRTSSTERHSLRTHHQRDAYQVDRDRHGRPRSPEKSPHRNPHRSLPRRSTDEYPQRRPVARPISYHSDDTAGYARIDRNGNVYRLPYLPYPYHGPPPLGLYNHPGVVEYTPPLWSAPSPSNTVVPPAPNISPNARAIATSRGRHISLDSASSSVENNDLKLRRKPKLRPKELVDHSEKVVEKLRMEIEQLAKENARLQASLDDQDLEIRAAQDVQARVVDSKGFAQNEDDGKIRTALLTVASSWRTWAKAHAAIKPGLKETHFTAFLSSFGIESPFPNWNEAYIAPSNVLNAALAGFIRLWILERPFHFLPGGSRVDGATHPDIVNEQKAFQMEYERAYQKVETAACRRRYCQMLATDFLNQHGQIFQAPSEEGRKRIFDLLYKASEASIRLWKQNVSIEFRWRDCLGKLFEVVSDEFEAHSSQQSQEPEAKGKLVVGMVIQPAIIAISLEGDNKTAFRKVWLKGIVILNDSQGKK